MKRRPWPLIIIVWCHLLAPVGNILLNSISSGNSLQKYLYLLFQGYNFHRVFVFILVPILAGSMIYICKKWSYLVYIVLMIIPVIYSGYAWTLSGKPHLILAVITSYFVNIIVVGYFMRGEVRKIYFDAKMRWWETQPRFHSDFTAEVSTAAKKFQAQILNLSNSGMFFQTDVELAQGEQISVHCVALNRELELQGHVVYARKDAIHGFGVKFDNFGTCKKNLKEILKSLEKNGAIVESRLPGPQDSFLYWIKSQLKN